MFNAKKGAKPSHPMKQSAKAISHLNGHFLSIAPVDSKDRIIVIAVIYLFILEKTTRDGLPYHFALFDVDQHFCTVYCSTLLGNIVDRLCEIIPGTARVMVHGALRSCASQQICTDCILFAVEDFDECKDHQDNCGQHATCDNTAGSFACKCNDGFDGDGVTCEGK